MCIYSRKLWAIIGLVFSTNICAGGISKLRYMQLKNEIYLTYEQDIKACGILTWNAYEVCMAVANGTKRTDAAKILSMFKPNASTRYEALSAKANSDYSIAIAKCNGDAISDKSSCWTSAETLKIDTINAASIRWGKSIE